MKVNSYSALTNSISGTVDADATSATICWQWKGYCDDECNPSIITGTSCETIPLTPNDTCSAVTSSSSITWNNESINYTITQNPKTEGCDECSANTTYQLIDSWLDKSVFSNCEDGCGCDAITIDGQRGLMASSNGGDKATLYYRYYEITKGENCPITRTEKIGSIEIDTECKRSYIVSKKSGTTNISGMTVPYTYYCNKCDECEPNNAKIYIGNVTYDKEFLTCSGNSYDYNISYRIVYYDENCKKTITDKVKRDTITFDKCSGSTCCEDHYVISTVEVKDKYEINGVEKELSTNVDLKMLVKGDYDGSCYSGCNSACTYEVTYCTEASGTVLYPYTDEYGNPQWVKEGEGGYKPVPYQGGDVKVEFKYSAYTIYDDCSSGLTSGTTHEIIQIPSLNCDEWKDKGIIDVFGEIEYKALHKGCSNILEYKAKQESPTEADCGSDDKCDCEAITLDETKNE